MSFILIACNCNHFGDHPQNFRDEKAPSGDGMTTAGEAEIRNPKPEILRGPKGRKTRKNEPQITQINADRDRNPIRLIIFPICAHLRNLRYDLSVGVRASDLSHGPPGRCLMRPWAANAHFRA